MTISLPQTLAILLTSVTEKQIKNVSIILSIALLFMLVLLVFSILNIYKLKREIKALDQ